MQPPPLFLPPQLVGMACRYPCPWIRCQTKIWRTLCIAMAFLQQLRFHISDSTFIILNIYVRLDFYCQLPVMLAMTSIIAFSLRLI